jgi:hypothetical protein
MQKITLSADDELIRSAREKAQREKTTLNALFRIWLARYVGRSGRPHGFEELMQEPSYAQPGKKFTRDELNER